MIKIKLLEFLSLYQYSIYSQYHDIYGSDEDTEEYNEELVVLSWKEEDFMSNFSMGVFYCLMRYSNITKASQQLIHFVFLDKTFRKGGVEIFGKDLTYDLYIGKEVKSGKIVLLDMDSERFQYIAKDEMSFLQFLIYYLQYTKVINSISTSEEFVKAYRTKSIETVGGDEYKHFSEIIYVLESDLNQDIILDFPFDSR